MARSRNRRNKLAIALLCGLVVGLLSAGVHLLTLRGLEHNVQMNVFLGDFVAGLAAVIVCLGIQLRQEEIHYATAMDRAAIVSELNHHVRNAIFPLCLTVQKLGDAAAVQVANDSVERINVALRDATADALSGRTSYGSEQAGE